MGQDIQRQRFKRNFASLVTNLIFSSISNGYSRENDDGLFERPEYGLEVIACYQIQINHLLDASDSAAVELFEHIGKFRLEACERLFSRIAIYHHVYTHLAGIDHCEVDICIRQCLKHANRDTRMTSQTDSGHR